MAINGYDDGASTGEVRRFLGDSLGPSDFRKNASRLASMLRSCSPALIEIVDSRLPASISRDAAVDAVRNQTALDEGLARRAEAFIEELKSTGRAFDFGDCSIGNLVFAGSFLLAGHRFNLARGGPREAAAIFEERAVRAGPNPRLVAAIAAADLVIYAPGTQHSSLFPSYLTPGLSTAIARNLRAIKLLVTNIQADAEIAGSTAMDIIERARYYLQGKGVRQTPTPCLITHYVVNDPGTAEVATPYVPLGQSETLEDPRLVRVANYEDGVSGRHDAPKILGPFIQSLLHRHDTQKLAIFLHDAGSSNKLAQSIVEMVRGGLADVPVEAAIFYEGDP